MRRSLEVPLQLPGIDIQCHDRSRPKIAARASVPGIYRIGISRSPVDGVERGVVSPRQPGHAAAVFGDSGVRPRLKLRITCPRGRVPTPLCLPIFRVHGQQKAGNIHRIPTHANQQVVLDDHRCSGREILLARIDKLLAPSFCATHCIECDQPAVGANKVQRPVVKPKSTVSEQVSALVYPGIRPKLLARASVDRKDVVRNREVEPAIDQQRRTLDLGRSQFIPSAGTLLPNLVAPLELEVLRCVCVNLVEFAEPPPGEVPVVGRPTLRGCRAELAGDVGLLSLHPGRG